MHALRGDRYTYLYILGLLKKYIGRCKARRLVIAVRVPSCIGYVVDNYISFLRIDTMTDTPKTSSEPQKPATPAPTPQQNQGTPKPDNDKGQQQK
jgi:hypothetical protein